MLRTSRGIRYHRFDIGTHDRPNLRLLCILPELIRRTFTMSDAFAQPFHCDVDTDFSAVSEAVHDGARGICDGDFAGLSGIPVHAFGQPPSAEPNNPNGRVADSGLPC